jgi:hypothetical protein
MLSSWAISVERNQESKEHKDPQPRAFFTSQIFLDLF